MKSDYNQILERDPLILKNSMSGFMGIMRNKKRRCCETGQRQFEVIIQNVRNEIKV